MPPKETEIELLLFKQVITGGKVKLGTPPLFPFSDITEPKGKKSVPNKLGNTIFMVTTSSIFI